MGPETVLTVLVVAGLFVFGILYNCIVSVIEKHADGNGYTAFLVVGGVMVTLAGMAIVRGLMEAWYMFLFFSASGLPMIVGAMWRKLAEEAKTRRASEAYILKHLED